MKKTRAEVFAQLQTNPKYNSLHKAKDEVERALKHARAARSPAIKSLLSSFDRLVAQLIKIEDAALKKSGKL